MTDRSKLLALAEAVEKLSGADREVDAAIGVAIGLPTRDRTGEPGWHGLYFIEPLPSYTASLDAAMTLRPTWAIPNVRHDADVMRFFCQLENSLGIPFKGYAGYGESYALAVCVASLVCLAAQAEALS